MWGVVGFCSGVGGVYRDIWGRPSMLAMGVEARLFGKHFFSSFGRMYIIFFESWIFVIWQCSRQIFGARQENSSFGC